MTNNMPRQSYGGTTEPWPKVSSEVDFKGQKLTLEPKPNTDLNNANTFTNLNDFWKDNIDSIAVPPHMKVRFDTWYKNNKNDLTPVFDGHQMGFDRKIDNGVSALANNVRDTCSGNFCVKSADSYGVERKMDWKPFVVKCCAGAGGGIVDSGSCGEYWKGRNKNLCDGVMREWCKPDPNESSFSFGKATTGEIGGRIYNEYFDEATAQRLCNAEPTCTGISKTQHFYFELRASSEVYVNPDINEYTMLKKDIPKKQSGYGLEPQSHALMYGETVPAAGTQGTYSVIAKVFEVTRRTGVKERIAAFYDGTYVNMVRIESDGRSQKNYGWWYLGKRVRSLIKWFRVELLGICTKHYTH